MKLPILIAVTLALIAASPLARAGSEGCEWSAKKGGGCESKEETATAKEGEAKSSPEGSESGSEQNKKPSEKPVG